MTRDIIKILDKNFFDMQAGGRMLISSPDAKQQLTILGILSNHNFVSDDMQKYAGGIWLEQYVFENLNSNRKKLGITDIYWGVEIKNIQSGKKLIRCCIHKK